MASEEATDTIVAIATAPGNGGVGVVRLSGPRAKRIGQDVCAKSLRPRHAHYVRFADDDGNVIDDGIALWFAAPASFTGEDVVELQAHGSPAVLRQLVVRCCGLGARMARPGEFSQRAYRNGRLDLAQAEAIADLIAAADVHAARAARRALDGEFSRRADAIADALLAIRVHVEAAIDFADEPIDTLGGTQLRDRLESASTALGQLLVEAERGRRLRDGLHAVIVGPPNAGKSALLNALAGYERAIVTDVAGTTRDLLHETIHVDGMELTLVDTAGLREGGDVIEREGMRRAQGELERADLALVVVDARDPQAGLDAVAAVVQGVPRRIVIHNKIDLVAGEAAKQPDVLHVSALTGAGLEGLHDRLREVSTGTARDAGGAFTARVRHVEHLRQAAAALREAREAFARESLELSAEALRHAHDALGEITGRTLPDDLLGEIFSSFCIGK